MKVCVAQLERAGDF